jgi:hypothetical protein
MLKPTYRSLCSVCMQVNLDNLTIKVKNYESLKLFSCHISKTPAFHYGLTCCLGRKTLPKQYHLHTRYLLTRLRKKKQAF